MELTIWSALAVTTDIVYQLPMDRETLMTLTLSDLDPDFDIAVAANAKETVFALPFFSCQNITEINQKDMHEFNPMKILTDFCEGSLTGKSEPEGFGIHYSV